MAVGGWIRELRPLDRAGIGSSLGRLRGTIPVAGYTPIVLMIMFFGGLTALGLGIIGQYLWLSLQNARRRPNYVVRSHQSYPAAESRDSVRSQ